MRHVEGDNKHHKVMLYALSTCPFCRKVKEFLNNYDFAYDFVDVDLQSRGDRKRLRKELIKFNPRCSYPTLIIDDKVIVGYREDRIREVLGV